MIGSTLFKLSRQACVSQRGLTGLRLGAFPGQEAAGNAFFSVKPASRLNMAVAADVSKFEAVPQAPADPILGVSEAFKADTSDLKLNLGVGAYRTEQLQPMVLNVVKKAEKLMLESDDNKEYLPIEGLAAFNKATAELLLGADSPAIKQGRVATVQGLSGTGSLRLGAAFIERYFPGAKVLISSPTWGNHKNIFNDARVPWSEYRYFDPKTVGLDFDGMYADIKDAPNGSVILLHGCAHNPTGIDPTPEQWNKIADLIEEKGHLPFFDVAYQGFASGSLDQDADSVRLFVTRGIELLVAQSYSKNLGLYAERVGAINAVVSSSDVATKVKSQLKRLARPMYSNPPVHGAKIVANVVGDAALFDEWRAEMQQMAGRIKTVRQELFDELTKKDKSGKDWSFVLKQIGMFSFTGLNKAQSDNMTDKWHIYMTKDGRISLAGLNLARTSYLADGIIDSFYNGLQDQEFGRNVKSISSPLRLPTRPPEVKAPEVKAPKGVLKTRPPVVTVMGHVDHGKTSLLDALRETSLAAKEAGGITQHLGAFVVSMSSGASLTFLDTPGHAAFSSMRARGAAVTDIVVLVVAADDGVMPQTREAMSHALAARVPIVVAINKCDKPEANPERVRQQLVVEGLELEDIGGEVQVVEISATKHTGLDKLEEALLLQAEMMDLVANSEDEVHAVVVEARIDRGQGPLATAIVKVGTLRPGQYVVVGNQWGRIRVLRDMLGKQIPAAGPSTPVEIDGLKGPPEAGDEILVVATEEQARTISEERTIQGEEGRLQRLIKQHALASASNPEASEEEKAERAEKREMVVLVKADVKGTAQAVSQALESLSSPQVAVNIVHTGVGPVSQSDVALAEACGACVVGFNIRAMAGAVDAAARRAKIKVCQHRIIYHLLEDMGNMIVSMAAGKKETQVAGQAEILSIFEIKGKGRECRGATKIAGCRVLDGKLTRSSKIRVLRSGDVLFEGPCLSLRREKDDVETVVKGTECGMILKDWVDFQVGDVVQCIEDVRRMPKFVSSQSGAVRIEC